MNETLPKNAKFIPENVIKKGKILNIDWIRWAEAVLFTSLTGGFMWSSGFTVKVKMIVLVVLGTSIAAFFSSWDKKQKRNAGYYRYDKR